MNTNNVDEFERSDIDMDEQRHAVYQYRQKKHQAWCEGYQNQNRFSLKDSRIRAEYLVNEACRMEMEHIKHQIAAAKEAVKAYSRNGGRTVGATDHTPSPRTQRRNRTARGRLQNHLRRASGICNSSSSPSGRCSTGSDYGADLFSPPRDLPKCGCINAPISRLLNHKFRAMNLLRNKFEDHKLEQAIEQLSETYPTEHDMIEDLVYRYGPEDPEDVDPYLRLRCAEEKLETCQTKWRNIGAAVKEEMKHRDQFTTVIRNLSIMRIFLEGSQAKEYGCDFSERSRRDACHQAVLDELAVEGTLFATPRRFR